MLRPLPEMREAEELIAKNKLARTVPLCKRCLEIVATLPDLMYRGAILFRMAKSYQTLGDFDSETEHLKEMRKCLLDKGSEFLALVDCSIAIALARSGNLAGAKDGVRTAVEQASSRSVCGKEEISLQGLAKLHVLSGVLSYLQGSGSCLSEWARAEELVKGLSEQCRHEMLGMIEVLRGDFYKFSGQGKFNDDGTAEGDLPSKENKAVNFYISAEGHYKAANNQDGVIVCSRKLGALQGKNGEEALKSALAAAKTLYGNKHPVVAECLRALAYFYHRTGESTLSEGLLRSAIALLEKPDPFVPSSSTKMLLGETLLSYADLLDDLEFNGRSRRVEADLLRKQCTILKETPQRSSEPSLEVWLIHELSMT